MLEDIIEHTKEAAGRYLSQPHTRVSGVQVGQRGGLARQYNQIVHFHSLSSTWCTVVSPFIRVGRFSGTRAELKLNSTVPIGRGRPSENIQRRTFRREPPIRYHIGMLSRQRQCVRPTPSRFSRPRLQDHRNRYGIDRHTIHPKQSPYGASGDAGRHSGRTPCRIPREAHCFSRWARLQN